MAKKEADTSAPGDLDRLSALLDEAAEKSPPRRGSAYEQVKALLPKIDALFARRYTRAEVRDLLAQGGLEMSLGTFSQYYAKAKRESEWEAEPDVNKRQTRLHSTREQRVNKNAKASVNPSELAGAATATSDEGKAKLGHRINDDDV